MTPTSQLPDDIAELKKIIKWLQNENQLLREQFELARRRQFAASSEKSADQLELIFNEAVAIEGLAELIYDACVEADQQLVKSLAASHCLLHCPRRAAIIDLINHRVLDR